MYKDEILEIKMASIDDLLIFFSLKRFATKFNTLLLVWI
ncbi:hypothetical protein LEP1GSC064_2733 [Leptospira kirschneri serovar Grippotyphosa str. Moskva]|nr:hypothetical protein LEP1GSC064_2733 [Leptospira kirschneri serovar Grippotyphosa str. Moskva]